MSESTASEHDERRVDSAPEKPTSLGRRAWLGVLKRTVNEFRDDNLTDWAAALTYYAVLSIFPARSGRFPRVRGPQAQHS
jgi:hypothetical protein